MNHLLPGGRCILFTGEPLPGGSRHPTLPLLLSVPRSSPRQHPWAPGSSGGRVWGRVVSFLALGNSPLPAGRMSLRGGQAAGRGSLCLGPAGGLRNVRSPQELSSHLCPFPALVVTSCHPILFTGEASSCVASSSPLCLAWALQQGAALEAGGWQEPVCFRHHWPVFVVDPEEEQPRDASEPG